jgi:hypothetical protein
VAAIWLGMALLASVVSIRIAVPAALVEIVVGALAGNIPGIREHVTQTLVITFLAGVGSLALTFLAGAEIDPVSLCGHWKASLSIGTVSFALPFLAAFGFCKLVLGWHLHAALIGGIALSTTSVAVVYAEMVETGQALGALACWLFGQMHSVWSQSGPKRRAGRRGSSWIGLCASSWKLSGCSAAFHRAGCRTAGRVVRWPAAVGIWSGMTPPVRYR